MQTMPPRLSCPKDKIDKYLDKEAGIKNQDRTSGKIISESISRPLHVVNEKKANAKSILGIMSLGIKAKTEIEIECNGEDEKEAMTEILKAFENKFGE